MPPDLRIQGFGFTSHEPLKVNHSYYLVFDAPDLAIKTKTIIRHEKLADDGYRYGCEIMSITKTDFNELRRYVLLQQLLKGAAVYGVSEPGSKQRNRYRSVKWRENQ
ncbi:PilZ domain-containing protein [Aneurinibacillus sp. BA2021]|nr:PilZ domain-containing protein [Aneurinibacillus sp. BA2021]